MVSCELCAFSCDYNSISLITGAILTSPCLRRKHTVPVQPTLPDTEYWSSCHFKFNCSCTCLISIHVNSRFLLLIISTLSNNLLPLASSSCCCNTSISRKLLVFNTNTGKSSNTQQTVTKHRFRAATLMERAHNILI